MVSITPILAAKPGNRRAGIHIGVEKASSRTAIAFDNNLTSKFMDKFNQFVTHRWYVSIEFWPFLAYNALVTGNTNHPMSSIVWDGVGNLTKGVK